MDITNKRAIVSSAFDLGMDREARKFIGEEVTVQRKLKSGLYVVALDTGETYALPKRNLDLLDN